MTYRILQGDWLEVLRTLPDESVHCVVTSPPYWGLRDYGTATWEGGEEDCKHEGDERYYTEQTASESSAGAFTQAGEGNAARLKKGRWREKGICVKCGAIRIDAQLGLERTPEEYVAKMVEGFREVRRVLRSDGTCWVNLGDSYNASPGQRTVHDKAGTKQPTVRGSCEAASRNTQELKPKDLVGIPWRIAFALQSDGWWLRQDIIWAKPNPMPESITDRCTKSHEYIFLLTKNERYFYDNDAIKEDAVSAGESRGGGKKYSAESADVVLGRSHNLDKYGMTPATRNKRSVWNITTKPYSEAHFATFPPEIPETCIKAGCPIDGTVLDPFNGAGTTGLVATRLGRNYIGIELNPAYVEMAARRIVGDAPMFNEVTA